MKRFKTVHYTIHSNKIKDARGIRFAVLADLHGMEFGPDNRKLSETIHRYRPDGILIAGDMIVRNDSASLKTASSLLRTWLSSILFIMHWETMNISCTGQILRRTVWQPDIRNMKRS